VPGTVKSAHEDARRGPRRLSTASLGRATSRKLLLAALAGGVAAYYAASESLPELSTWWDIAALAFALIPAVFAFVLLVLPWWRARGLLPLAIALGALAAILQAGGLEVAANFAKLAAATALGFWFLEYFDDVRIVLVVAAIVPLIDAYSVWRGPTHHIVTKQRHIFTTLSFAFPVPGEHASANLGVPDLLFFAVFLAAAARFRLRTVWTWVAMTLSFGATMALAVWSNAAGLPALPGLSIAFLAVNADLLWRQVRRSPRRGHDELAEPVGGAERV
jgi:hypothetical protein